FQLGRGIAQSTSRPLNQLLCRIPVRCACTRRLLEGRREGANMKMPERSKILETVERYQQRDPDLYSELRQKAEVPHDDDVFPIAQKATEVLEEFAPKR